MNSSISCLPRRDASWAGCYHPPSGRRDGISPGRGVIQATIGKVDVEAEPAIAERFGVQALPSLLFFKGGERVDTLVGRVPKAVIADRLRVLRD